AMPSNAKVTVEEAWRIFRSQERPIDRSSPLSEAVLDGRTVRIDDYALVGADIHPESRASQQRAGFRSWVATPLTRDRQVIGVLVIDRNEVRPFSDDHVALLETFADQAVIAIENARLFEALREANQQLAEASQHKSAFLANMSHELRTPL